MKKSQSEAGEIIGDDGFLSPAFVASTGLSLRLFYGAPSLLELALLNALLFSQGKTATLELLGDNGEVESRRTSELDLDVLVEFMSEKFAKYGVIRSASGGTIAYFDQSNDYFAILSEKAAFTEVFRLHQADSVRYLRDMAEQSSDPHYLETLLTKYESLM